ncbi:dipeptidyl-peptidase 3 family protein [Singulisphaera acidiphila]|uniref:Peptidase family M49 n=1 Tax=Singulisphaera acidiphila (strain ATCC BAA-1392 / DSM 18658 / VKM B-2454 / MOB10) TaxID=886293 RepID=L0DJ50_SINAD|nr:peptidase M49 [Singulisphaera acidiphila]AGA28860.1 Peptidase family M49 [Singulisphaera acidiphila DSM 18658]
MRPTAWLLSTLIVPLLGASALAVEPNTERPYLLERVDDAAVTRLYADGFTKLPLDQKVLLYHLYQAAVAGRDIYYDQRYVHSLVMREILESILTHSAGVEPTTLDELRRYTKLFWLNSGPYNHLTARKFVLKCTPEAFAAAAKSAARAGAMFPTNQGETVESLLERLRPSFFDASFEPIVTNKSPGPGKDILATSANNLYVGVEMKDLAGFREQYPLNSRLVKRDGQLVEEPYRVGGKYSEQITRIVGHLEEAAKHAPATMRDALLALVQFYQTGTNADREKYDIAWVRDKDSPVDTINGFIEVYMDARGVKGSWESAVFFVNQEKTGEIRKLAADAQWFEDHMPWLKEYRKPNVQGITANAIEVVIETGDCGPITPIGINLPNDQEVRERYGSKSVSLSNVLEASDKSTPTTFRAEFSWTPEEVTRATKWSVLGGELLVNMHEVIGHASGRINPKLEGKPQDLLKEQYSALEEGRADLVALYFMPDPRLAELGLVKAEDQAEVTQAVYENYTRNALVQLRRIPTGAQIEEDHMRNRQMVVRWLMDHTKAIDVRQRDGKTFYVMTDAKAFHEGVGKLLAEVQRIKSEGDYEAAKKLFETYGIHFDPKLRDEVQARVKTLDLPSYTGYVMPRLTPVKGDDGTIRDVTISYPKDLTEQMLEFSAVGKAR